MSCNCTNCSDCNVTLEQLQGPAGVGVSNFTVNGSGQLVVTLTTGSTITVPGSYLIGTNGNDGQGIDHIIRTAGTGAPGTTDTYTIWGDVGETINLGTFTIYNGANGANGNDGADNIAIVYSNVQSFGSGLSTATTGSWVTLDTYTLPASTISNNGEYLDIDVKLTSDSPLDGTGLPSDFFRITYDTAPFANKFAISTIAKELLAMYENNSSQIREYNINIKLFKTASTPLQTQINWNCSSLLGSVPTVTAGAIQVDSTLFNTKDLTTGGDINFDVYQSNANSVKIEAITIKHIKT